MREVLQIVLEAAEQKALTALRCIAKRGKRDRTHHIAEGVMPRSDQLGFRINPALRPRLNALAARRRHTVSEMARQLLEAAIEAAEAEIAAEAIPNAEADATLKVESAPVPARKPKRKAKSTRKLPRGVTDESTREWTATLIRCAGSSNPLVLEPDQLLSSKSRAMYRVLAMLWHEDVTQEERTRILDTIEAIRDTYDGWTSARLPPLEP